MKPLIVALLLLVGACGVRVKKTTVFYPNGRCETGVVELGYYITGAQCNPPAIDWLNGCVMPTGNTRQTGRCYQENEAVMPMVVVRCVDTQARYNPSGWVLAKKVERIEECQSQQ